VIIVESDEARRRGLEELLQSPDVEVAGYESGAAAIESLRDKSADFIVLTPEPADMTLATLAEQIMSHPGAEACPLLLYVEPNTPVEQVQRLSHLAQEFNLRYIDSPERLVDQASLVLCKPLDKLPEERQRMIRQLSDDAGILRGKKVLIVDDDIRNIFALTSILERYDMVTVSAETGRDAINLLQAASDVDIVLMDIMMPEMDGIDTMKAIRQISRFKNLPIVAVTAKAMKGDREKCIEAGAWDYLSKPVDPEQMLAVLRAWLTT
jgi:CheY-like chemotaxis protein